MRLTFEVWSSRLSLTALVLAGFLYLNAALLQLEMLTSPATLIEGVAESTIILLAHLALLFAVGFYARHVLLDATGRLKVHIDPDRKGKSKRAKLKVVKTDVGQASLPAKTPAKPTDPTKFGASPAASASAARPGAAITNSTLSSPDEDDDEDEDDNSYGSNLSKSERRRLKKLARREQQRRAA